VLLLQHQQAGTALSTTERQLAVEMIEDSDNNAATSLWDDVEGPEGMEAGDAALGLRDTVPGDPVGSMGMTTTTTVNDQLRLLDDLTSARSLLTASARGYELGGQERLASTRPRRAMGDRQHWRDQPRRAPMPLFPTIRMMSFIRPPCRLTMWSNELSRNGVMAVFRFSADDGTVPTP
jgi:hypothetical protein